MTQTHTPELAIVLPTFNERENIPHVVAALTRALPGIRWEAVFVDDDSPDGTCDAVLDAARYGAPVRLLHRIGRRGLSSACIEGMLASAAPVMAVMDADLQHDPAILPEMLARLRSEHLDIVVGTRNADGGSMGEFSRARVLLSRTGKRMSHAVCRCTLSDPMSGFFMLRRDFLLEVVHDLRCEGFKILVDLLSSCKRCVRLQEVGYTFRNRERGESKLDAVVGLEYLFLVANKLLGDVVPVQLTMFLLVGGLGLLTHFLALLFLVEVRHVGFVPAQMVATGLAMTENFFLNNRITFRDRRLRGREMLPGLVRFAAACSFGAWSNVIFARDLWQSGVHWWVAGLAGIVMGSVWNLSISSFVTWPVRRRTPVSAVGDVLSEAMSRAEVSH